MDTFLSSNHNKKPNQRDKIFGGLNNLPSGPTMDPVSILSTIGAVGAVANGACTLAFQLYTFIEDTKNVNQAVTDLAEEVNSLNSILEAVKLGLESDPVKLAEKSADSDDSQLLWESIQGSLNDCQATIERLERSIVDVRAESKNFAKQAVRRIKLNLKDNEIATFRTQIRTHINALQMALLMVNLRVACLAPGVVTNELGPKIDELRSLMELVHGSEADLKTKSLGIEPDYLTGLRQSAQRVISSATTVGANSEAAGSVWGEIMDDEKRNKTLLWIPEPEFYEEHEEPNRAHPLSDTYSASQTTALTDYSASNAGEAESDSDGGFDSDVVKTYFLRGSKKFNDGNFTTAQSILQRSLQLAEKLPLKHKQPAQIAEIKLMIATCIYHSPNLSEAEARLLAITQEKIHENVTDEGAIRRCQASHLLAAILFRQGRYPHAKSFCRKALIGRRRLLGKNHISYHESLSLLSQICEADGQQEDAETYWAMIPDDVAPKLVKIKDEFPDMLQRPEISPTRLRPSDNTKRTLSPSKTQFPTAIADTNKTPTTGTIPLSLSPTASPTTSSTASTRLLNQAMPSPSRESTALKLPSSLPRRTKLTPTLSHRSPSTPIALASITTPSSASESPVQRNSSIFKIFSRRQTSASSTASTTSTEIPIIQEKGSDFGITGKMEPPLPQKGSNGATDAKSGSDSFLEFLHDINEQENRRDEGNHWPGLN